MKDLTRNYVWMCFLLATFAGVSSCGEKKPADILTKPEMVRIMEEIYIVEEKLNYLSVSRDSSKKAFEVLSAKVFRNADVTDSVFRKSFDYYMERPREMELIYTALVDTLQLREQRAPFRSDQ